MMADLIFCTIIIGYCVVLCLMTSSTIEKDYHKVTSKKITGLRIFNIIGILISVIFIISGIYAFYMIFRFLSYDSLQTKISNETYINMSIVGFIMLIGGGVMLIFFIRNIKALSIIMQKRIAAITHYCLNCGAGLFADMIHCPECGQYQKPLDNLGKGA